MIVVIMVMIPISEIDKRCLPGYSEHNEDSMNITTW